MKDFAISDSHLTLSEASMRKQGQRRLQARKESRRSSLAQDRLDLEKERVASCRELILIN